MEYVGIQRNEFSIIASNGVENLKREDLHEPMGK
jgi:hypothetical protein